MAKKNKEWRKYNYQIKYPRDKSFLCAYCREDIMRVESTVDHVLPKNKLGCRHRHNRLRCCRRCNLDKTDKYLDDWFEEKGWEMPDDLRERYMEVLECYVRTNGMNEEKIRELGIKVSVEEKI